MVRPSEEGPVTTDNRSYGRKIDWKAGAPNVPLPPLAKAAEDVLEAWSDYIERGDQDATFDLLTERIHILWRVRDRQRKAKARRAHLKGNKGE